MSNKAQVSVVTTWIFSCCALALTGCGVQLRAADAQQACSALTEVFCERLSDCDGSVDKDACITADDALGGACVEADVVDLESDLETCKEALGDMECAEIENRTAPDFELPCVRDIEFVE